MTKSWQIFTLAILMLLLLPFPARAGDCSGPDDCAAVPDNGTRAAIGGGIVAGILLYRRTRSKKNGQPAQDEFTENTDAKFGTGDPGPPAAE